MNTDLTPTPEQIALENKFLECVREHPGITAEEIAEEIQVPVQIIRQACAYCLGAGTLDFSDGRYFVIVELVAPTQDPFFVAAPKPKLPDLTPPTEAGLDGWTFFYGLMKEQHNLTLEQFAALPIESQNAIQDAVQSSEIILWRDSLHSQGYVITQQNFASLGAWLNERRAPITQRNLTQAFKAERKYLDKVKQDHGKDEWQN